MGPYADKNWIFNSKEFQVNILILFLFAIPYLASSLWIIIIPEETIPYDNGQQYSRMHSSELVLSENELRI